MISLKLPSFCGGRDTAGGLGDTGRMIAREPRARDEKGDAENGSCECRRSRHDSSPDPALRVRSRLSEGQCHQTCLLPACRAGPQVAQRPSLFLWAEVPPRGDPPSQLIRVWVVRVTDSINQRVSELSIGLEPRRTGRAALYVSPRSVAGRSVLEEAGLEIHE
jgi:hypothetical protein